VCAAFLEALGPVGQGASARLSASGRRTRAPLAGLDTGALAVDRGPRWGRSAAAWGHRHAATRPAGVPPARAAPPHHRSGPGRSAPRGPHRQSARSGAAESGHTGAQSWCADGAGRHVGEHRFDVGEDARRNRGMRSQMEWPRAESPARVLPRRTSTAVGHARRSMVLIGDDLYGLASHRPCCDPVLAHGDDAAARTESGPALPPQPRRRRPQRRRGRGPTITILIIDDEEPVRQVLLEVLRLQGYRVITAASVEQAEARLHSR
jgi:CheY-like chemotaxis protein